MKNPYTFGVSLMLTSVILGLPSLTNAEEESLSSPAMESQEIQIQEIGTVNSDKFKGRLAYFYYGDRDELGLFASKNIEAILKTKGIEHNTFAPRNIIKIRASARIYAVDTEAFDTRSVIINDIRKDKLVMSKTIQTDSPAPATGRNPLKVDGAVVHYGAQAANTGALGGYGIGILANVAVNLAKNLFAEKATQTEIMTDGNAELAAANCGAACAVTHHQIVFRMNYGRAPEDNYTLILDKVNNEVDSSALLPLANMGLELMAVKIKQVVSGETSSSTQPLPEKQGSSPTAAEASVIR